MPATIRVIATCLCLATLGIPTAAHCQPPVSPAKSTDRGAAPSAAARLLKEAQALAQRQEYRRAEKMLSAALQAAGETGTARLSPSNVALMSALGDVLVNSGKYQSAIGWLERAREASEQTADPSRQSLADQAAIALLLSNAYGRLGQIDRAIAALQTTLSHYEKANVVDPVVQLELIAGLLSFDRTFRPTATNAALAEKVGRLADQLAASHQRELIGVDDYARGLTALADCRLHLAEADAATLTTEKLIHLRTGGRKTLEEMAARRRLAEIYRGQVDYESEIKTLRAALDALGRQQQGDPAAHDFQVRLRYERAEIERLLVAALLHGEHQEEALSQLDRAEEDFVAALALARLMPTGGTAGVSQGRLLERIADVARQRLEMGRLDAQRLDRAITAHAELLDDYRKTLLADDPRIGSLELILGSLHLQAGDAVRAAPPLQAALAYWRKREPPDRYRLAQALHLVGEASLASIPAPRADQIEHYLAESHRLCLKHFPQDPLRWRVQLALGRLAVGMGRYGQALDWLHELSADNPSIPNEVCSAALLQLGLLYKQLLKFDEADRLCRAGLALRRQAIGEHDAGLSPFYLALGSLQVARRDVDALDGYVARNVALGVAQSHNAPWRWDIICATRGSKVRPSGRRPAPPGGNCFPTSPTCPLPCGPAACTICRGSTISIGRASWMPGTASLPPTAPAIRETWPSLPSSSNGIGKTRPASWPITPPTIPRWRETARRPTTKSSSAICSRAARRWKKLGSNFAPLTPPRWRARSSGCRPKAACRKPGSRN